MDFSLTRSRMNLFLVSMLLSLMGCSSFNRTTNITNLDSSQWYQIGEGSWTINDQIITGSSLEGEAYLMSRNKYEDFLLTLEFKPDSIVNSGIYVRCSDTIGSAEECHEINIWDNHPNQANRTGAIVNKKEPSHILNTIDKWNTYEIRCLGDSISVMLNGMLVSSYGSSPNVEGFIGLQAANNGKIEFRNLSIEHLK